MELKAPTTLRTWTSSPGMNVVKLLSNVEFEVREKIQMENTDLNALWISD